MVDSKISKNRYFPKIRTNLKNRMTLNLYTGIFLVLFVYKNVKHEYERIVTSHKKIKKIIMYFFKKKKY